MSSDYKIGEEVQCRSYDGNWFSAVVVQPSHYHKQWRCMAIRVNCGGWTGVNWPLDHVRRGGAEHAHDLRDLASDSRNWRLAYPSGTDRLYIGDCPRPRDDDAACGTRLYQRADRVNPAPWLRSHGVRVGC